ncbi:MAG: ACP S-malonyltransferase [Armatimonas sp.]
MKSAFVFPGQGAQSVGMGKALYESNPAARVALDTCEAACPGLLTLCFEGPEETLKETRWTQPALFAVSVAAYEAVKASGVEPVAVAGHSIGEYAALYAAGVFDIPTGMALVRVRAEAMAEAAKANPGAMAAVLGLDPAAVASVCGATPGIIVPANLNCPGQVVISGEAAAVEAASAALKEAGAKRVIALAVSGAFHSPLMQSACAPLEAALTDAPLSVPTIPVIANVTAAEETATDEIKANLVAQVPGQVRWIECIEALIALGVEQFIECGSGTVLAGLNKKINGEIPTVSAESVL